MFFEDAAALGGLFVSQGGEDLVVVLEGAVFGIFFQAGEDLGVFVVLADGLEGGIEGHVAAGQDDGLVEVEIVLEEVGQVVQ